MKRLLIGATLTVALVSGCLSLPERTTPDPVTGAEVEQTTSMQVETLEEEAAQLRATIESLNGSAGLLPPPFNMIAMGILASLSGALEQQRRKLKAQILAQSQAPSTPA